MLRTLTELNVWMNTFKNLILHFITRMIFFFNFMLSISLKIVVNFMIFNRLGYEKIVLIARASKRKI